ncbi:DUF6069 family protein [Jiangella alba]|uniref:Uncharacterized protein n=1 Tax=Jiangella alba TaxID=561176 RepID=A0A1H5MBT3_9ACTN|nr:DUF6069 family protein [Jiangella alba]SEE86822.1 hypothetical protein SAMN04488561_3067 [Jiangella alba]
MTSDPTSRSGPPVVDAGRLWAGGVATAVIGALIAVVGIVLIRGVFDIPILAPEGEGTWGDASTGWYAGGAALAALVSTALVHVLLLTTPQPLRFFAWVVGLATVIGVVAPFTSGADLDAEVATAGLNLVLGIAIGTLVSSVARSASRPAPRRRPGPPPADGTWPAAP